MSKIPSVVWIDRMPRAPLSSFTVPTWISVGTKGSALLPAVHRSPVVTGAMNNRANWSRFQAGFGTTTKGLDQRRRTRPKATFGTKAEAWSHISGCRGLQKVSHQSAAMACRNLRGMKLMPRTIHDIIAELPLDQQQQIATRCQDLRQILEPSLRKKVPDAAPEASSAGRHRSRRT